MVFSYTGEGEEIEADYNWVQEQTAAFWAFGNQKANCHGPWSLESFPLPLPPLLLTTINLENGHRFLHTFACQRETFQRKIASAMVLPSQTCMSALNKWDLTCNLILSPKSLWKKVVCSRLCSAVQVIQWEMVGMDAKHQLATFWAVPKHSIMLKGIKPISIEYQMCLRHYIGHFADAHSLNLQNPVVRYYLHFVEQKTGLKSKWFVQVSPAAKCWSMFTSIPLSSSSRIFYLCHAFSFKKELTYLEYGKAFHPFPSLGSLDCYKKFFIITESKSHLSTLYFLGSDSVILVYLLQSNIVCGCVLYQFYCFFFFPFLDLLPAYFELDHN